MASKKLSGSANRKRKLRWGEEESRCAKSLAAFFKPERDVQDRTAEIASEMTETNTISDNPDSNAKIVTEEPVAPSSSSSIAVNDPIIDYGDPANWPFPLSKTIREHILTLDLKPQINENVFPKDADNRSFSKSLYYRSTKNGESYVRSWLCYSKNSDRIYCIPCKLFFSDKNKSSFATIGSNKWKNIHDYLRSHENSPEHRKSFANWFEACRRLESRQTIDQELQADIIKERDYWRLVLERLCNIILYLATHNIALRGSSDQLFTQNNGNFLGLVELLGKYDVTMHEHLRRILSRETRVHYCSNTIQNEIITMMASSVKNTILDRARQAKYFSIILDCTPDLSHKEQLSITIRFVDVSSNDVSLKEHFITYRVVHESSGQSLFDLLLKVLEELNLDIQDCRGQGYDNGSNMKGKNKGVQARILQVNPRAFFMPCGCHSLNLVISDCAISCKESISFFGTIQRIYTLFSASVGRWKILTDTVSAFTLKPLCTTRWESRIECLKPLRYQIGGKIYDALLALFEHGSSDPAIKHEAQTLASQLYDYNFLVMIVIWYDILFRINIVSKSTQSNTMDLGSAVSLIESCAEYVENYRFNGFDKALVDAKELAEGLDVDPIFVQKRVSRKKRMFNYEHNDEIISDPQNFFKTKVFYVILDTAIISLKERFEQLKMFQDTWGFLFDISKLPEIEELKKCCSNLEDTLRHGNHYDILGSELYDELQSTSNLISKNIHDPLNVLKFINQNNLQSALPNLWTALRILLTIPITVASAERSFSKLKLIKTYLRTSSSDDRLSALAILSIENEIAKKIDLAEVIKNLADLKARKKVF